MTNEISDRALERMTEESIEAMKNRNGPDTHNGIPRKLKSLAYDLWGRDPKKCVFCGTTENPHLHHVAPEVMDYLRKAIPTAEMREHATRQNSWPNPYNDTEPWQLVPLCPSCHRKVENQKFTLMHYALWWAALKKRGEYEAHLHEYLDERDMDAMRYTKSPDFIMVDEVRDLLDDLYEDYKSSRTDRDFHHDTGWNNAIRRLRMRLDERMDRESEL